MFFSNEDSLTNKCHRLGESHSCAAQTTRSVQKPIKSSSTQSNIHIVTNQRARKPMCLPPCQQTNRPLTLESQLSCQDVTKWIYHTPTHTARQPIHKLTISKARPAFQPATQSFSHTESMLHFHLVRCVEVKNGQSQRLEISHLTLPCSLPNTHYFVLSESFYHFVLCLSHSSSSSLCVCVCVSICFLILVCPAPIKSEVMEDGGVLSHCLSHSAEVS